jgi:hypothetical protein
MSVDLIDLLAEFARVAIDVFLFAVYAAALRTAADGIAKIEHEIQIPRALILWLVPQLRLTELGREIAEWFEKE